MKYETDRDKSLRTLQMIQLEILGEIDRICRKNDIQYALGGGTCLGQVRHGGFIPWDDDIDLDMTRDNLRKFINCAEKEMNHERFKVRSSRVVGSGYYSNTRVEAIGTKLSKGIWTKNGLDIGVFVDIFEVTYLPNDPIKRKKVSKKLFNIRCLIYYKMFKSYPRKLSRNKLLWTRFIANVLPISTIFNYEKKLIEGKNNNKTDWIMDDSIINGYHGEGYPADLISEYEDVKFEDLTVMNRKNKDGFLVTLYGENYNEWLPPLKRISHHKWDYIDFGTYAQKYNTPSSYKDCMSVLYSVKKLQHMKTLSYKMIEYIGTICECENLQYYVLGADVLTKTEYDEDVGNLWISPMTIGMPRADYDKFEQVCKKYLGNKYDYQTFNTDDNYKYYHSRFRLNNTYIRDIRIPVMIEEGFSNGFYVRVIALDNGPNDKEQIKKHIKKLRRLNDLLELKWTRSKIEYFIDVNLKSKIKLMLLAPVSVDSLLKRIDREAKKYSKYDTENYIDSSGYQINGLFLNKKALGNGQMFECNGSWLNYPTDISAHNDAFRHTNQSKLDKDTIACCEKMSTCKVDEKEEIADKFAKRLNKRYPTCYLNYYDIPDYQLSVLRYDEINDKYLSNDDIMGL